MAPAGWKAANSSGPNRRMSMTVRARASPRASMQLVEAVGASPWGQASSTCP